MKRLKFLKKNCLLTLLPLIIVSCSTKEANNEHGMITRTSIGKSEEGFHLLVNDEPFYIKGAGIEFGNIAKLAEHGGNSFRTWRTNNGRRSGKEVLDEAQQYGLKVMMGIDVERERHGFDYNDEAAVEEQLQRIKLEVLELKDHPALMVWDIGNELNLSATNPKVWDAVNAISKMIHEVDPYHLTTTSLSGISKDLVDEIRNRAPDLDFLCTQLYAEIENLPILISNAGLEEPYAITEWGATGHWEIAKTAWGAPIENNSSVKANLYRARYEKAIASQKKQCIGSYVFLWGQKQERTPTWYGVFLADGTETESVDVMHYMWTGAWPKNQSPHLVSFEVDGKVALDNIYLNSEVTYTAHVGIMDPDNDSITYRWEIMHESKAQQEGGDIEEVPEVLQGLIAGDPADQIEFKAPKDNGAYRLFVYAYDGNGHAAHANIPFYVGVPEKK